MDAPLAEYGAIGDRRSTALVRQGSIDWWCPRRFDAPSVCARLLGEDGGHMRLGPARAPAPEVAYDGETNVLKTEWTTDGGRLMVHDLMPLDDAGKPAMGDGSVLRIARCLEGEVGVHLDVHLRPDYGRTTARTVEEEGDRVLLSWPSGSMTLACTREVQAADGAVTGTWDLEAGEAVSVACGPGNLAPLEPEWGLRALENTRAWWRRWGSGFHHQGPYREAVLRSALTLEMLTYAPTGAIVAAATTSLPEWPGEGRNWDYRYVWMRDAAFAVDALEEAGHEEQALRLGSWIHRVLRTNYPERLEVLYTVDGRPGPAEEELGHLGGYRASRPVRVGNGAIGQFQLDVYGELVECLHLSRRLAGDRHEEEDWPHVRRLIDAVCGMWRRPDQGIWEMRCEARHFVLSKVLAWVALDRGLQAVEELRLTAPVDRWREEAQAVRDSVLRRGYDPERRTFVQAYGHPDLDASNLLIPILGFLPPDDERVVGTVEAVQRHLTDDGLVRRYEGDDGVGGDQAAFAACSFWLVEALAMMGRRKEAHETMASLMRRATPLGLYAQNLHEDEHLGNYPQALTHIALISAATALERTERRAENPSPHLQHVQGRGFTRGV